MARMTITHPLKMCTNNRNWCQSGWCTRAYILQIFPTVAVEVLKPKRPYSDILICNSMPCLGQIYDPLLRLLIVGLHQAHLFSLKAAECTNLPHEHCPSPACSNIIALAWTGTRPHEHDLQ